MAGVGPGLPAKERVLSKERLSPGDRSSPGERLPPGERIRLHRRRAGLTQEQCAQLKGCTASAWRKWESGERKVASFADWVQIANILRVRDLYQLTGLPAGVLPDRAAEHDAVPAIRVAMTSFAPKRADRLDSAEVTALADAVDRAWSVWQEHRSFAQVGALLPELIVEVRAAIPLVHGDDRGQLLRAAVMAYFLTRSFTKRVGAEDLSLLAADRAMAAAVKADDLGYRAAAAWNMGMTLYPQGHSALVATLAGDAADELEPRLADAPPEWASIFGALHLLRAIQFARLRDEHAALSALDRADGVARRLGDRNDFRTVFGPTNVGIHRVWLALELCRPAEAIRQAQRYDVTSVPSVERRFFHYVNLARAYGARNEDVAAVHMLLRAEHESAWDLRYSVEARGVVHELLRRESPVTRTDLRPLADRLGVLR
jgi:transcriptional regulator with XRE-family HTH domain